MSRPKKEEGEELITPHELDKVEEGDPTDLDIMLETLNLFNVQYTMIRDEAGTTIECVGGDRGMSSFSGLAITYNFGPGHEKPEFDERFLFIGLTRT